MNDYKIFTYDEFNKRVEFWWDIMVLKEFKDFKCVPIKHDIAKRRTNNLGMAHYKKENNKVIPSHLSFSFRLLDGRYTLNFVDSIIRHEIGHHLNTLRNGYSRDSHGGNFKKIAKEFDFNGTSRLNNIKVHHSEIYDEIVAKRYKYFLVCDCGKEYKFEKSNKLIKSIIKRNSTKLQMACHRCNRDDRFALYIFKDGVKTATEIDYEAYYNLMGGEKIR